MSPDHPVDRSARAPLASFEDKWSRRAALLVGAGGLATAGVLLFQGFEAGQRQSARSDARMLPYHEFLEQLLESRIRASYSHVSFGRPEISGTRKRHLIEEFKRGPLYEKIARETQRWFKENRRLAVVARDDVAEMEAFSYFLASRLVGIQGDVVANLENTPEGRFLLGKLPRGRFDRARSSLIVTYGNVITHSVCFLNVDSRAIFETEVSRLGEQRADKGTTGR
jgi:hypothetical protein